MTAAERPALSAIPDTAPKPQDHKPKKSAAARQAEADGFALIKQCGVTLRIPLKGKVPLKAYIAFKAGDEIGGTEALLGPDQWEKFLAKNPTLDDYAEIAKQIEEHAGNP